MLPNFQGPCGIVRVSQFFDMDGEMNPADVAQTAVAPVSAAGFSFVELFMQASIVVKIVMTGLGLASIWSWAIIFEKLLAFRRARIE